MAYTLGIDIGTQSVKTGLLDTSSFALSHIAARQYPCGAIQSTDEIWQACLDAISETVSRSGGPASIHAVGLSGQMHGTVLCDTLGEPVHPLINWQDERCNQPVEKYGGKTTIEYMYELLSGKNIDDLGADRIASGFMGATLFHIMENDPQLFSLAARALPPTDFIRRRLTGGGEFATDPTNAFATGLFNTREGLWHSDVISSLGLPQNILPSIKNTSEISGGICADVSRVTGLRIGAPVATGGGDNQMAMLGSGAISPGGPLCINIGTSSQICAVIGGFRKIPGIDTRSYFHGNLALVYAGLAGGKCYTWLKDTLLSDTSALCASARNEENVFGVLDRLAEEVPSGCDGLTFTPTLRGTRRNPALRGEFKGIGENNFTLGHRARAVMEGVVSELLESYNLMGSVNSGFIAGAGAGLVKSEIWQKITSRAFGLPLKIADMENAVFGAAASAAEGAGLLTLGQISIPYIRTVLPE